MKRAKQRLFTTATVLLLGLLVCTDAALPFKKVSIAKTPTSTTSTSTTTTSTTVNPDYVTEKEESTQVFASEDENNKSDNGTLTRNSKLTGIPQIDYIWDPNLPRELRGFNLSTYPFLSTVPPMDEIHFKCEGLHDGFYASIEYKCQIYHHCVYGIRHDFLCANFTAFDQRTFICHFASDVDCEGSQKYWNRNDELYMATTTSSTSTTTTVPPPTQPSQPRRRVTRPYGRPYTRRPVDEYYDEDDFDDDYYEERERRRKPRPRKRKPQPLEYDDEYDDKRIEVKPTRRNRNHYRDEEDLDDDYYEERRNRPGSRRGKPTAARSKQAPRKPGRVEERRSFNEDRDAEEPRRTGGRRRNNEKRTTPSTVDVLDELDEYEKPYEDDQEEAAEEQTPHKVKTTPKPLAEFITPKAAPASVYSRPRAPPRISRPVPVNEKKKYSYPVQKNTATTPAATAEDEDYYQDQDHEQPQDDDEYEQLPVRNSPRRRTVAPRDKKQFPARSTLRKPVTDKTLSDDQDYYAAERQETPRRKGPQGGRTRGPPAPEPELEDDVDYVEKAIPTRAQRLRPKAAVPLPRKSVQRPRQPIAYSEEEDEQVESANEELSPIIPPARSRVNSVATARRNQSTRQRALPTSRTTPAAVLENEQVEEELLDAEVEPEVEPEKIEETDESFAPAAPSKSLRPASVRVVKRPFLPSRGGSPYLPRGLQPVGVAVRQQPVIDVRTTESTPIDMGSTISGVRLLEHGAPLLRGDQSDRNLNRERDRENVPLSQQTPSTFPPRSALPTSTAVTPRRPEPQPAKLNLDELYENDYDVTLNDALDPTLKPLTSQHSYSHQQQLSPQHTSYQGSRPASYVSAYAAPAGESVAFNPFSGHGNNYQQTSIYQNHSPPSALQSQRISQPLSPSPSQSPSPPPPQSANYQRSSDSYFSSTDIRRRAIDPSQVSRSHRQEYAAGGALGSSIQISSRPNSHFYDDSYVY